MNKLKVEKFNLSKNYNGLKIFDCHHDMINNFVYKSLKKRVKKHLSQAYILLDMEDNERVIGFYTLDTFAIARDNFEIENKPSGLPPIVPVVKLSMLGIDKSFQGQGLGKRLLRDALLNVGQISQLAGCAGIYLLAEQDAISFYKNLGFIAIKEDNPLPMFLNIDVILALIPNSEDE
ncbi:MAG: GNAT family N-acetyltransferase [Sulfurovum sp.]|nr:GNAT family N-acetyltransferase [Sulfurovum sp.]